MHVKRDKRQIYMWHTLTRHSTLFAKSDKPNKGGKYSEDKLTYTHTPAHTQKERKENKPHDAAKNKQEEKNRENPN